MFFLNVVTILILIDGFLQYMNEMYNNVNVGSHNPYFNRWFSAIIKKHIIINNCSCHNPYFNRWFSAIKLTTRINPYWKRHNPYFNRWFSAIKIGIIITSEYGQSQSLF